MNFSTMFANEETGEYWPELQAEIDRWQRKLSDDPGALNHLVFTHMEAAALRRQLVECQAELATAVMLPPATCGDRGFVGYSACHLPAGHDGPHEHRSFVADYEEKARGLSSRR